MSKNAAIIGVIACLGALTGTILLTSRAKASPLEPVGPDVGVDDILASSTLEELDIWYVFIGQLYLSDKIDKETYDTLYGAYVTRFHELTGVSQ